MTLQCRASYRCNRKPKIPFELGDLGCAVVPFDRCQGCCCFDQLLDLSRLHNAEVYDRSIDVQILRLRRKIEDDPSRPRFITTERGVGYLFDAVVEVVR